MHLKVERLLTFKTQRQNETRNDIIRVHKEAWNVTSFHVQLEVGMYRFDVTCDSYDITWASNGLISDSNDFTKHSIVVTIHSNDVSSHFHNFTSNSNGYTSDTLITSHVSLTKTSILKYFLFELPKIRPIKIDKIFYS